jgi:type IV pilus assembly protein PilA
MSGNDRGFTLIEIMTVVAILGVVALLALPSLQRMNRAQKTKSSATQMAGVLENARSSAISEGTPHLVYVNEPTSDGSGAGCGPIAVVVRDTDRSYTLSDGDRQQEISLDSSACGKVKLYAQDDSARPYENLELPVEDQGERGAGLVGGLTEGLGLAGGDDEEEDDEDSSGPGSGLESGAAQTTTAGARVEDAVVNGSTFPVDEATGRPVIAFSERGIPVDPQNPTRWGSGAGAIYLTDGTEAVFAAVVHPMGEIKLRKYEPAANEWR